MGASAEVIDFPSAEAARPSEPNGRQHFAQVLLSEPALKLGKVAYRVLAALYSHVNLKRGDLAAWPGAGEIAREAGLSTPKGKPDRRRVWRALAEIEAAGIIRRENRASAKGDDASNRYTFLSAAASLPTGHFVTTPSDKATTTILEQGKKNKGKEQSLPTVAQRAREAQQDLFSGLDEEQSPKEMIDDDEEDFRPLTDEEKLQLAEFFETWGPEDIEAASTPATAPRMSQEVGSARGPDRFEEFCDIYPKQTHKKLAWQAWERALKVADAQTIIDGAEDLATAFELRAYGEWRRWDEETIGGKYEGEHEDVYRYVTRPDRWLDDERWTDDLRLPRGTSAAERREEEAQIAAHPEEHREYLHTIRREMERACSACGGSGNEEIGDFKVTCRECKGSGQSPEREMVDVTPRRESHRSAEPSPTGFASVSEEMMSR